MEFYVGFSNVDGNIYVADDLLTLLNQDKKMLFQRIAATHTNIPIYVNQFCWENEITNPPDYIKLESK